MYGHNEKCTCVFCGEGRRVMGASSGTDQRLDMLIAQNNRMIEQTGQLIDLGQQCIAALKALLPDERNLDTASPEVAILPGADRQIEREPVQLKEPARRRRKP